LLTAARLTLKLQTPDQRAPFFGFLAQKFAELLRHAADRHDPCGGVGVLHHFGFERDVELGV